MQTRRTTIESEKIRWLWFAWLVAHVCVCVVYALWLCGADALLWHSRCSSCRRPNVLAPLLGVANENMASRFANRTSQSQHIPQGDVACKVYPNTPNSTHPHTTPHPEQCDTTENIVSVCFRAASFGFWCYYYNVANIKSVLNSLYASFCVSCAINAAAP